MRPNTDEIAIAFETIDGENYEGTVEIKYSMCDLFEAYDLKNITMRTLGILGACYFYRHPERQDEDVKHHLNLLHKGDQFTIMHFAAYCSGRYRGRPGEPDFEPQDVTKPLQESPTAQPQAVSMGKPRPESTPEQEPVESKTVVTGKPRPAPQEEPPQEELLSEDQQPELPSRQKKPEVEQAPEETARRPMQAPTPPAILKKPNGKPKSRKRSPVRAADPTAATPLVGKRLKEVEIVLDDDKAGKMFLSKLEDFTQPENS